MKEELEDVQGKVLLKNKSKLVEKGTKRKKSKHHCKKCKNVVVGNDVEEEVEDDGDEGEHVEELEEVKGKEVAQPEKVAVKKGHFGGSSKKKKSMEVEKEEEEFPTLLKNLYIAKATTLIALVRFSAR
jgi:hypothetical protein